MRTPDTFFKGIGVHLPETVTVESAAEQGLYPTEMVRPEGLRGAAVAGDLPAPEMAVRAARQAFERCGHSPADVDLMLYSTTWPQTPEGLLPPAYIQEHLTGGDVLALEIRQGCNATFGALEVAAGFLRGDPGRRAALLVAADNYGTPLMDRWRTGGPFILGDCGSAVVLTKEPGFAQLLSVGTVAVPDVQSVLTELGEPLFPPTLTAGRPIDFTRGAAAREQAEVQAALKERSIEVTRKMTGLAETILAEAGITFDDITRMAVMNVERMFIESAGIGKLGVDIEKSTWEFGRHIGHGGPSDQITAFDHLLTTGQLKRGDHLLMISAGPSISISCAVVKILDDPPWTS